MDVRSNQSKTSTMSIARRSMIWGWKDVKICGCTTRPDIFIWRVRIRKAGSTGFPRLFPLSHHPQLAISDIRRSVGHLNATGRSFTDRIAVLDTRGSGPLASRLKWLSLENFSGINGDGTLNLHGFDIRGDKHTNILRILLINHRPPFDPITGAPLDASKVGANSTIEQFQTKAGTNTMRHVRTYVNDIIQTPNRVAWMSEDTFVFTNSHSAKVGFVSLSHEIHVI